LSTICAGLVSIDKSNIIRLVHYTAQEYFECVRDDKFPTAELVIARSCLRYLQFAAFYAGPCDTDSEMQQRLEEYRLLEYAAQNWGHHALAVGEEVQDLSMRLLDDEGRLQTLSQVMHLAKDRYPRYSQAFPRGVNSLHIAAWFGLYRHTDVILVTRVGAAVQRDSNGQSPLLWAVNNGHVYIVRRILRVFKVDINDQDVAGRTALSLAARHGHLTLVKDLLALGVKSDVLDTTN